MQCFRCTEYFPRAIAHLFLMIVLSGGQRKYYFPHFVNKEIETQSFQEFCLESSLVPPFPQHNGILTASIDELRGALTTERRGLV